MSGVLVAQTHVVPVEVVGYVAFLGLLWPANNFVMEGITFLTFTEDSSLLEVIKYSLYLGVELRTSKHTSVNLALQFSV